MTFVVPVVIVIAILAAAAGAVLVDRRRRSGIGQHLREQIVVNRVDGQSIRGILTGEFLDCIELTHAEFLGGESEILMAGTILIPHSKIAFIQKRPVEGTAK